MTFLGRISQQQAAFEWANMDIGILPSEKESFGVAAVEAQACETPVIVSEAPGLVEVTIPGKSSIVVNAKDAEAICDNIHKFYSDRELLSEMGKKARKNVLDKYELNSCFSNIENLFLNIKMNIDK